MNLVYNLAPHGSSIAQWLECLTGISRRSWVWLQLGNLEIYSLNNLTWECFFLYFMIFLLFFLGFNLAWDAQHVIFLNTVTVVKLPTWKLCSFGHNIFFRKITCRLDWEVWTPGFLSLSPLTLFFISLLFFLKAEWDSINWLINCKIKWN